MLSCPKKDTKRVEDSSRLDSMSGWPKDYGKQLKNNHRRVFNCVILTLCKNSEELSILERLYGGNNADFYRGFNI